MVWKYLCKKWNIREGQIESFATHAGDFQSGVDVNTLNINGQEVKVLHRRIVTDNNLDDVIDLGW